jgi:hypothetical protein
MVDYYPLSCNHKHPEPDPESAEEQEGQAPVVVDVVWNAYEERNGKTIALKVTLRLPLKSERCTRKEAGNHLRDKQ